MMKSANGATLAEAIAKLANVNDGHSYPNPRSFHRRNRWIFQIRHVSPDIAKPPL
jgi:hypothetical protein